LFDGQGKVRATQGALSLAVYALFGRLNRFDVLAFIIVFAEKRDAAAAAGNNAKQHDSKQVLDGLLALQKPLIAQNVPRPGDDMGQDGPLCLGKTTMKNGRAKSLAETYQ
jgi:hypothetical protein